MSDSVEVAIQRAAAAGAATTGPVTPIVIKEDRSIVVPTAMQQIAVQCDNEANVLHFVCPRNWANIDLAAATLYINVVKPDKSIVAFTCTNVASSEDTVTFDWVITEHITEVAGKLSFLVCARDPSDPGDGYRWHSNLCDSLFVAPGIVCTVPNILPDPPHIPLYGTDTTLTEPGVPADAAAVGVQLSSLSEKITNLPQADWNQNDSTAADYVKNRPFYTGDPVETVVVEESTATFADDADGLYTAAFPSTFVATVGETYKISWDGTVYECTCVTSGPGCVLGNLSIVGAGSDTGEPFLMCIMNGEGIQIITADTSASHTFSISRKVVPVVKIDKKYLVQPDWNQNDSTAADYVKNRTHYEESSYIDYVLNESGTDIVGLSIPAVGGTVTVKINGVESTETVKAARSGALGDYTYIGNVDFDALRRGRNGWLVAAISGGFIVGFAKPDTTISVWTTVIHKIDKKYLVQPDWNQNDSTAADYVKNRTHYEESSYTDYVLNMDGPEITGFSMPEVGGTVTVKINGVESTETVKAARSGVFGDYTYIGTIDFDSLRSSGTGWLVAKTGGKAFGFAKPDTTISVWTTVIHKIDEKYLPDTHSVILPSSTEGSTKKFKITVDDSGTISATEVV